MFKRVLLAFMLASLLFTIFLFIPTFSRGQGDGTVVKVEPEKVTMGPEPAIGQQFTIDITLYNVVDLYGWEVKLFWDNSLLNCTAEEFPILPEGLNWETPNSIALGPGIEQNFNATHGRWFHGLSALPVTQPWPESFNGTMNLVVLTFNVMDLGVTTLDLRETKLADPDAKAITHSAEDSEVTIVPEFPATVILSLFFIGTLVAIVLGKKVWSRKPSLIVNKPNT